MTHHGTAKIGLFRKLNLLYEQVRNVEQTIAERKLAEVAVRKSEEKYRDLFENANDAIFLVDAELNYTDANKKAVELLGYSREQLLGMNIVDLIPQEQRRRSAEEFRKLRREGKYDKFRGKVKTRDDRWLDVEVSSSAIFDGGSYIGSRDILRDITEQVRTEQSLLLFRNLLNQSKDAIFVNDPATGRFLIVNDKACSHLGYDRSELLVMRTLDIEATFRDQAAWDAHVNEVRSKGYLILEGMNKRNDGTLIPVEVNVTYMTLAGTDYMVAVVRDITERKLSQLALQTSELRLSKAQKMAHVGNWEWNLVTNHLYWSEEVYHIYGVDPAHFIPTFDAVGKAMHPDDLEPFIQAVNAALYERKPFEMDYRLLRPDGTVRTVHTIGEVSYDPTGKPLVKSGTVQDITDHKLANEKLSQSEKFVRTILDTVDAGFIVIDPDFRIVTANKAYCDQVGDEREKVIGRHCYEVSHRSNRPCYEEGEECPVRYVFETGKPYTALHRHPDANDAVLYVETKGFPIKDASGAVTSVIEVVNDITEKQVIEEVRLKTQKLEAIGTLAGGIAHDFNNLLQGVFGYIHLARTLIEEKERSLSKLAQAEQALNQCVNLTKQLLTFSKGGMPLKKTVAIEQVVEQSVKFALSGSSSDYRLLLDPDLWKVEADEEQIAQVVQNIVLNADQAMEKGGTVMITVRNARLPRTNPRHLLEEGNYLEIAIQDTGVGIPEQHLLKIFDPYFTTKQKGSGLGLATSYSIVKNHGGMINVVSDVNKGTTFFVYLPAMEQEAESRPEISETGRPFRQGKILVMDDEQLVREIAVEMLSDCGHEVEFAEHGEEAIAKYEAARESGGPFDIVILDLTIRGGLGGKETMARLLEIDPGVKAIVSSGYSDDTVISEFARYGFSARLTKPYKFDELKDIVNRLLP